MMTKADAALKSQQDTEEFLSELARLCCKYRTEVPLGALIGALEIVKMRLQHEARVSFDKKGHE